MNAGLREMARALGGKVFGQQILCPGPGHSARDLSLSVTISASSPDGFLVHSFGSDDFRDCRDYVKERLGMEMSRRRDNGAAYVEPSRRHEVVDDDKRRIERARAIWAEGGDPRGTLAEKYLALRRLSVADVDAAVIRFHPRCPWRDDKTGVLCHWPCMIAAMRSIATDEITAIHRTALSPGGEKVDRRMLGIAAAAAIKLDPDDAVTAGLHVGEGIETCLAARQLGLRPTWALASAGAIAAFPVLAGVECLTLLGENDAASAKAVQACAQRWYDAGREVLINHPICGKDLNDAIRGAA